MIEVGQAKNGSFILKKDGKYLASSFDPQKEAETWLNSRSRLGQSVKTIFVLGLGCGYHIDCLRSAFPQAKLIVVEADQYVATLTKANRAELGAEVIVGDPRQILTSPSVIAAMQGSYAVLVHQPSCSSAVEFYQHLNKSLLAREVEGFFSLLKVRPEIYAMLDERKLADLARTGEPVTIRTISKMMRPSHYADENQRLWKVLEELIT